MSTPVLLNNIQHRDLKVNTQWGEQFGDNIMCTLAIPSEFRNLVADYTILFHHEAETNKYLPMVMFGFQQAENLFLNKDEWNASYIPLLMQRGPFLIGFQQNTVTNSRELVINVDMDNARVGKEGEQLFTEFGDNTPYLESVVDVLAAIDQGQPTIQGLSDKLIEHKLLDQLTLDIKLDNGEQHSLQGFYTVTEERLTELADDVILELHNSGLLSLLYMVIASTANIPALIRLKNERS